MANSLQEQLLKTGLITEGQAKQQKQRSRKQKRRKSKAPDSGGVDADVRAAQQAKQARDRALNEEREAVRRRKELRARMRELLRSTRVNDKKAEDRYNFALGSKLKSLYVTDAQRSALTAGKLAVVLFGETLYLVPIETVEKARALDPGIAVHVSEPETEKTADPDDPYAGYEVPDDLMW